MDDFLKAEEYGRKIYEKILVENSVTDYHFSENKFERYDVEWTDKKGEKYVGEIKFREKYSITSFDAALIEKHKFDDLVAYAKNAGKTPYYIMLYNDNVMAMWNLFENKPKWEARYLPRTTKADGTKVLKPAGLLQINKALIINLDCDIAK